MSTFALDGQRLAYTVYGEGPRVTVLLHGLLFSQRMHESLARALAERGNRVVTFDLLGHGESDRPREKWRYSMPIVGSEVVALLDRLGEPDAVVLGTSRGANVALEVAAQAPERLRGIPRRRLPRQVDILLDWIRQDPEPSGAVLQGLFFGRTAPPRDERQEMQMPALVIGHQLDLIHPFSDAGMLTAELPDGRLLEASSLLELRVAPRRLSDAIAAFIAACWRPQRARAPGAAS